MKKIIYIISLITLIIASLVFQNLYNKNYQKNDDTLLAITLDGNKTSSYPAKGDYIVNVTCSNAKGTWDYKNWTPTITQINGNAKCSISFTTITTKNYLNAYVQNLANDDATNGVRNDLEDALGNYRYQGRNPNNYVWFNNELWRIIGSISSTGHGQSSKHLIKIIRNDILGAFVWDKNSTNNWENSTLKALLNTYYYTATDGTDSGNCVTHTYQSITPNCDYRDKGIQEPYRSMIINATWKLGACDDCTQTAQLMYNAEKGTAVTGTNPATTTGYVGLMYTSDYILGVLGTDCWRGVKGTEYTTYPACYLNDWLFSGNIEWLISPSLYDSNQVVNLFRGKTNTADSTDNGAVRPTVFLNENVYLISGTGTEADPYIINM